MYTESSWRRLLRWLGVPVDVRTRRPQRTVWQLVKRTFQSWSKHRASHLAAALAYYGIFSLTPLLVVTLAIASMMFGTEAARSQLVTQVQIYSRSQLVADLVQSMVDNARQPGTSLMAAVIGVIGLFYGATGVFNELKHSMNLIWDAPARTAGGGLRRTVCNWLFTLAMVAVSGLVLAASLILGTILTAMQRWMNVLAPGLPFGNEIANFAIFLIASIPVFMLMYKYIPDVYITWRDVTIGAVATAVLFSAGRYLISLYLVQSDATTPYGAAASLALLLLWAYYSAQVFFLGAEFTQVYARTFGSHHILNQAPAHLYRAQDGARGLPQPETRGRLAR